MCRLRRNILGVIHEKGVNRQVINTAMEPSSKEARQVHPVVAARAA
jgi:hypothetical protein